MLYILMNVFPSANDDDVRVDLFLLACSVSFVASALLSYGISKGVAHVMQLKFHTMAHLKFILLSPLLCFLGFWVGSLAVVMGVFIPDWLIPPILCAVAILAIASGHYVVTKGGK